MHRDAVPYQKILFVCVNRREEGEVCCAHRDSEAIAAALKARIKELGLVRLVRVSKSGCQDLCAKGPNVMVFPDAVWYRGVTREDVESIIQQITDARTPSRPLQEPAPRVRTRRARSGRSS